MSQTQSNSKKRTLAAIILASLVGVGGIAYFTASGDSANEEVLEVKKSDMKVNADPQVVSIPGTSNDAEFNKLQEQTNKENYEKAKQEGESFIPTIVNNVELEPEPVPEPEPEPTPVEQPIVQDIEIKEEPVITPEIEQPIQQPQPVVVQQVIKYEMPQAPVEQPVDATLMGIYQNEIQKIMGMMDAEQAQITTNKNEKNFYGQEPNKEQQNASTVASNGSEMGVGGQQSQTAEASFVRAGTIVPGVMLTAVNTDEPGPVMAEITAGPQELIGARLLGQVVNAPTEIGSNVQKATIQFTRIEKQGWKAGYNINVFAIDPQTSRTAVATSVDNHYFRRYGLGLAAAFVEGLGNAFADTKKDVTYTDQATIVSVSGKTRDHMKSALGRVGSKLGSEISKISDVPATIYVDSGTAIGLLFMSNF